MKASSASLPNIVITADSIEDLNTIIADMVNQGWNSDGQPVENPDGTYSITMVRA